MQEECAMKYLEVPIEDVMKTEMKEEETDEYVDTDVPRFKMERAARLPVKPIYAVIREKYPDIEALEKFVVQSYATGTAESPGSMMDQDSMTPDGEKSGRGYITSKYGDDCHPPLVNYMAFIQSQFEPFMHVRECGEFGSGFSVVMTGWPKETPKNMMQDDKKFGLVKTIGHRTKTHVDYDAGRGTSYSVCTAFQDDVFGILANDTGQETIVKLAKGETIIFSSSTFHFGCNHEDYNKAYIYMVSSTTIGPLMTMELWCRVHAIVPSFTWTTTPREVKSNKSWTRLVKPPFIKKALLITITSLNLLLRILLKKPQGGSRMRCMTGGYGPVRIW